MPEATAPAASDTPVFAHLHLHSEYLEIIWEYRAPNLTSLLE